ncbi:uncharacterized protein F5Z01DRAFT_343331 [Emericellopsis atlantica]|uniref:Uncharacterized protein n=1 Tax=Emericellopsis atlantica TaxID=2614577 RepID=A0A9P8CKY8_9HYPO|nr:uncharacterized protein F5Z01DRAFT_343331 [Emericellopsis atlantica]KAG9250843.1 hypothetical protein F5Z01DRAFT_343331 [Emericellopsis atlantica]
MTISMPQLVQRQLVQTFTLLISIPGSNFLLLPRQDTSTLCRDVCDVLGDKARTKDSSSTPASFSRYCQLGTKPAQEHQKSQFFMPLGNQLPSPPSRLTMCRDNSSHMICGLDVHRLLADSEPATHARLPFCDGTRGTILISLLSTSMDRRLLHLERSTSTRLPFSHEHDAFLKRVWRECNLHHEGLEASLAIQATWVNLVLKLATASVQSGASSRVSERTIRAWRAEPAKAYRWLREQRARSDDDAVTVTSWTNNPRDLTDNHKSILRQHIARGDDGQGGHPKAHAYIQRVADTLVHNALNKSLGEIEAASKGNMDGSQEDAALQRAVMDEVYGEVKKRRNRYRQA